MRVLIPRDAAIPCRTEVELIDLPAVSVPVPMPVSADHPPSSAPSGVVVRVFEIDCARPGDHSLLGSLVLECPTTPDGRSSTNPIRVVFELGAQQRLLWRINFPPPPRAIRISRHRLVVLLLALPR